MISQTQNMDLVNSILRNAEIWNAIAPTGTPQFDTPYMPQCLYFLVGDADGVIIYHPFRESVKIHPNILPEKRGVKSFQAIDDSIQAVFAMDCKCVYAEIDRKLNHVTWLARRLGFSLLESNERDLYVRRKLNS